MKITVVTLATLMYTIEEEEDKQMDGLVIFCLYVGLATQYSYLGGIIRSRNAGIDLLHVKAKEFHYVLTS